MFRPIQIIRPNSSVVRAPNKRSKVRNPVWSTIISPIWYPLHLVPCKPLELTVNSCQGKEPGDVDLPKSNTIWVEIQWARPLVQTSSCLQFFLPSHYTPLEYFVNYIFDYYYYNNIYWLQGFNPSNVWSKIKQLNYALITFI